MNWILSLRVFALSLAGACTASGLAFAQSDVTPYNPNATLVAQANTQQYVVLFALDDATLNSEAQATIAAAAQEFQRTGSARISLRGHTDTSGDATYNQALSERREQAVTDELVRQGVPADAISGVAVGEADPAVPTGDGVREEQNRRVEIALEAPPPAPAEPAPAPAPEPAPQVVAEPAPETNRFTFSVGPFYGYNIEDLNGGDSHFGGLNLSLDYEISPWVGAGLEQAGFYHFAGAGYDDAAGAAQAVDRFTKNPGWQKPAVPPRIRGVKRDDVQIASDPHVLKSVVQDQQVRVKVLNRPTSAGNAINIADNGRLTDQGSRQHHRFIT